MGSFFKIFYFLFLIIFLRSGFGLAELTEVTGADGVEVNLKQPAQRIISLSPDMTEILFSIGAGKNLVGVGSSSDYPKQALSLPIVAGVRTINLSRILGLNPDLIIAWQDGTSVFDINKLRELGIPVLVIESEKLSDISKWMRDLGVLTGHENQANQEANNFDLSLKKLNLENKNKNKNIRKEKIKVFVQVGSQPLFTLGSASIQSEIIILCGGENIFGDKLNTAFQVAQSAVIERNPDLMIGMAPTDWSLWSGWPEIKAVRNHQELEINSDIFSRPGPRILEAVSEVCSAIKKAP